MKNILFKLLLTLVLSISLLSTGVVNAENLTTKNSLEKDFGETISKSIKIKGAKICLYTEFIDREKALDNLKTNYNSTLMFIKDKWTSDSVNGWEKLEDSGYTYGIIRR